MIMETILKTERITGSRIDILINKSTKRLNKNQSIPIINPPKINDLLTVDFSLIILCRNNQYTTPAHKPRITVQIKVSNPDI